MRRWCWITLCELEMGVTDLLWHPALFTTLFLHPFHSPLGQIGHCSASVYFWFHFEDPEHICGDSTDEWHAAGFRQPLVLKMCRSLWGEMGGKTRPWGGGGDVAENKEPTFSCQISIPSCRLYKRGRHRVQFTASQHWGQQIPTSRPSRWWRWWQSPLLSHRQKEGCSAVDALGPGRAGHNVKRWAMPSEEPATLLPLS